MENIDIEKIGDEFRIKGFPDGIKVIRVEGKFAKKMADLSLHRSDLNFARDCLTEINNVTNSSNVLRQSLWRSAIIFYMKCFGNNKSRSNLNAKRIYSGDKFALNIFKYFKSLRNKHLVHDENAYSQALPGAILNQGDKLNKIEKVVCPTFNANTLSQTDYGNLNLLIQDALKFVENQYDITCEIITKNLEAKSYKELISIPYVKYSAPAVDEIDKIRKK